MPSQRRRSRPLTPEEINRIEQLLDDGVSYKEIGRTLDRHASVILRVAREYGWHSVWTSTSGPEARKLYQMLRAVPIVA